MGKGDSNPRNTPSRCVVLGHTPFALLQFGSFSSWAVLASLPLLRSRITLGEETLVKANVYGLFEHAEAPFCSFALREAVKLIRRTLAQRLAFEPYRKETS